MFTKEEGKQRDVAGTAQACDKGGMETQLPCAPSLRTARLALLGASLEGDICLRLAPKLSRVAQAAQHLPRERGGVGSQGHKKTDRGKSTDACTAGATGERCHQGSLGSKCRSWAWWFRPAAMPALRRGKQEDRKLGPACR